MNNISKETLQIRKTRLILLRDNHKNKLLTISKGFAEIAIRSRIDEIDLQIDSIDKLLNTSLVSFIPRKIHPPEKKKRKGRSKKKPEDKIKATSVLQKDEELFKI